MNCEEIIILNPEGEETLTLNPESEERLDLHDDCYNVLCPSSYEQLDDLPQIEGVTLRGDMSYEDLGIVNDKNYVHDQTTASDTWVVEHNLNKLPSVTVIDSAEEEVVGEVTYDNVNKLTIKFAAPFKGKATLN